MANLSVASSIKPVYGSWRDSFLAGVPHLLAALFIGMEMFFHNVDSYLLFRTGMGIFILAVFAAVAVYARRQRWPLWSASWYGYWSWFGVIIFVMGMISLNAMTQIFVEWKLSIALLLIALFLLVAGLFRLFRVDRLKGLLAALFLMPVLLPLMVMEFVPDAIKGYLMLGSGIVSALAAALIVHFRSWRSGIWFALGGNLIMGIVHSYVGVYKLNIPYPGEYIANPLDLLFHFLMFTAVSLVLMLGPSLFWSGWDKRNFFAG
jgi:hypothetical protein